jgi:salicylate hydroxylase
MSNPDKKPILVAGAGIAGLTAALAFARRGFPVQIFERTVQFDDIGAGIQLSPNATHILDHLGVLERLTPLAVRPEAVVLRRASTLAEVTRIPLGNIALPRWGAPYLTAHRADLHEALLGAGKDATGIELVTGAAINDFDLDPPALVVGSSGDAARIEAALVVAADGVWSAIRGQAGEVGRSRFIGQLAWRRTIKTSDAAGQAFLAAAPGNVVTAFLHPGFHLIAYPIRAGAAINLVAFTRGREIKAGWSQKADPAILQKTMQRTAPALAGLAADGGAWTAWPIHVADLDAPWVEPRGLVLIGDAAHAMTPFAAQGAAMAIEDAETLAAAYAAAPRDDLARCLHDWGVVRRRRVLQVARRGALNEFAWHARGPVAVARDTFLRFRGGEKLAADLDWLYGWRPPYDQS